jgi:uncharacterized protein YuzE
MDIEVTFDPTVNAAYVDLSANAETLATRQISAFVFNDEYEVILDISADNKIIGLEVIGASAAFFESFLSQAEVLDDPQE